jgi:hypothetical protein
MIGRPAAAAPPDYPSDHLLYCITGTCSLRIECYCSSLFEAGNVEGPSVKRFLQQVLLIPTINVR